MNKLLIAILIIGACTAANIKCPEHYKNNKVCTMEYVPVCGLKKDINEKYSSVKTTYGNKCEACSDEGVEFYIEGKCDYYPKEAVFCHPDASNDQKCNRKSFPVCGLFDFTIPCSNGPCGADYLNECTACINKEVAYFLPVYCDQLEKYIPQIYE